MKYTTHISLDYYVPATDSRHSSVATIRDGKAYAETEWSNGRITSHTIPGILAHRKGAIKRSHARALAKATPIRIAF